MTTTAVQQAMAATLEKSQPPGPNPNAAAAAASATAAAGDNNATGVSLTVRLIMQGKEVGSIIGKKGEIVKRFRDESGAKINISDGSCPERIVTISGSMDSLLVAVKLITTKFQEDLDNLVSPSTVPRPPITFRLVVPASQCGSLIGKGGSKIKEIREITGASIQVASEMLPNSTERVCTISGSSDAITQCVLQFCLVMSECPSKGITVPYRPLKPVAIANPLGISQGTTGTLAATCSPVVSSGSAVSAFLPPAAAAGQLPPTTGTNLLNPATSLVSQGGKLGPLPLSGMTGLNGLAAGSGGNAFANTTVGAALNPAAIAALAAAGGHNRPQTTQQTHEMTVPNELIGCIIGKGGSKIAEIRQLSGAMIRISNCEERDSLANGGSGGSVDRTITMTGNAESVALAQYLINMRISMETAMGGMGMGFQYVSPNHIARAPPPLH